MDLENFYKGTDTDNNGRTLYQIWCFNDVELEAGHDWVQILFPLSEKSSCCPDAPLLTSYYVEIFRTSKRIQRNLFVSFLRFCSFLGLEYDGASLLKAPDYNDRAKVWQGQYNHNYLRITRVIGCLYLCGLDTIAQDFYSFLVKIHTDGDANFPVMSLAFWEAASKGVMLTPPKKVVIPVENFDEITDHIFNMGQKKSK